MYGLNNVEKWQGNGLCKDYVVTYFTYQSSISLERLSKYTNIIRIYFLRRNEYDLVI